MKKTLAEMLREARLEIGLSQSQVGQKLRHSSGQYISNIECGRCLPTPKMLPRLAKVYRIDEGLLIDAYLKRVKEEITHE